VPVLCPAPPHLWKSFRAHGENDSGAERKPFAFPPESPFTFSPEFRSPSPRNVFHDHPGIAFTFLRNPQITGVFTGLPFRFAYFLPIPRIGSWFLARSPVPDGPLILRHFGPWSKR
jgi:hypothetical protein